MNLDKFDFVSHPLGLGYFLAYMGTLLFTFAVLWRYRSSSPLRVAE